MKTVPLRSVATVLVSNVDKKSVDGDRPVRLCNYTDVYYNRKLDQTREYMQATASWDQVRSFRLREGDTVITKDSETATDIGVPALIAASASDFVCGYHLAIVRPGPRIDSRYLNWQMNSPSIRDQLTAWATGVTRHGLTYAAINSVDLSLPPMDEQRRIANFLDDQVARLDAAWLEAQDSGRLIAARFQASVDVLFDGSGRTIPLKALLERFPQYGVLVPILVDRGVPFIRIKDLSRLASCDAASLTAIPAVQSVEYRRTVVKAGDVLIGVVGSTDKAAVVPEQLAGANIARAVARLVPRPEVPSDVLLGWLSTTVYRHQVATVTDADTAQPTLNMSDLRNFRVALPDRSLPALAASVQDVCEERRSLAERTNGLVRVLHERKQALITACVTGEFDVSTASLRARCAAL